MGEEAVYNNLILNKVILLVVYFLLYYEDSEINVIFTDRKEGGKYLVNINSTIQPVNF